MEKRKRFDDELLDLENPGADDSFLNEYLQDEESKKKLKKSSPLKTTVEAAPIKTIKISFKKFSLPNESPANLNDPVSSNGSDAPLAAPSLSDPLSLNSETIQALENQALKLSASSISTAPPSVTSTGAPLPLASSNKQAKQLHPKEETSSKIKENQQHPAGQVFEIKTVKNVVNDSRLDYIPKDQKLLGIYFLKKIGHVLYTGALQHSSGSLEDLQLFLLPKFSVLEHYALIEVRIPFEFLDLKENLAVQANAVWGTSVYTDDSDVIAGIYFLYLK